ncbi:MAG: ATP-binding protein [Bacteroidales bacterium]
MSYKIAIASGKGGTGKTTVAVNLYNVIAKYHEQDVLLVDCDVEEPNDLLFFSGAKRLDGEVVSHRVPELDLDRCTFCRKCSEYCEFNAITVIPPVKFAAVNPDLCHSCGACLYACKDHALVEKRVGIGELTRYDIGLGAGLVEGKMNVGLALQTPVIRYIKDKTRDFNGIALYDAPPGTSCSVVSTVADSDYVILVTEPTPFGLHDLRLAAGIAREMGKPFGVVVNKTGIGNNDLYEYLEQEGIALLAGIPFKKEYAEKYAGGALLSDAYGEYEAFFKTIANNILKSKGL